MATPAQPVIGSTPAAPGGVAEQSIPYARFKEVNDQLKAFKDLGFSPEEVQEALVALAAFVEQSQAAERASAANGGGGGQQPSNDGKNGQWTQKQWEEWALNTFPWMREMRAAYEAQSNSRKATNDYRVSQGQERLKAAAAKAGYDVEKLNLKQLEDVVAAIIKSDPQMIAAWENGDLSVVDKAFESHQSGFVQPVAQRYATSISGRKATNRRELAPKVTGGASPAPQQPEKPKTVADAHQAAMDKLAESGSDLPEGEDQVVEE